MPMVLEARVIFDPNAKLCGADAIVVDGLHMYGFAGDQGKTELHVMSMLKRDVKKLPVKSWLRGVLAEGPDWFAAGEGGKLHTSPDQGKTWRALAVPTDQALSSVARFRGGLWVAGVEGFVAHETDGGWEAIELPKLKPGDQGPTRLHVDGDTLYVLARGLWSITSTRAKHELASANMLTGFTRTSVGTRIVVGENGAVFRSMKGKPWKKGAAGIQDLVGVVDLAGTLLAARTSALDNHSVLATSTDDGKTFTALPLATQDGERYDGDRLGCVCVVSDGHGGALVAGYQGMLVRVGRDGLGPWSSSAKPAKKAAKPAPANRVTVLSVELRPTSIASDGEQLYVADDRIGVIQDGATITWSKSVTGVEAVCAFDKEVWASGKGLWRSTNRGKTLTAYDLPADVDPTYWGRQFHGIARDPSGVLWAGGYALISGRPGETWTKRDELGDDARIKGISSTPLGAVLLTFNGKAWLANGDTLRKLQITGANHLASAVVTPTGTLVIVGSGKKRWTGLIARSTDGKKLTPVKLPAKTPPLLAVAAFPDGRVIAGGEGGTLLVSDNDGKTFQRLSVDGVEASVLGSGIKALCEHRGAVYVGGPAYMRID